MGRNLRKAVVGSTVAVGGLAGSEDLSLSVARGTLAVLDLVDDVKQPEHFTSGDDVVPTGEPKGDLGKRPPAKGADEGDNIYPETEDPDSGDAVAHVSFPDNLEKALNGAVKLASRLSRSLLRKKGIAEDVNETMNDLSQAIHELDEVADALSEREQRLSAGA